MLTVLRQVVVMDGWEVAQRYEPTGAINQQLWEQWKKDAQRLLGAAQLKRGGA